MLLVQREVVVLPRVGRKERADAVDARQLCDARHPGLDARSERVVTACDIAVL